ncbi:hypothetical protein ID855_20265, partial [Xenorhabdus sp. ZM]|uniref:hypothetical protein n=1 Tax=Xenorhabdus szentirmaii TaxID=290112 RepID=UPI0019A01B30|nr:hypothetical protein [Xenorhabdus sp. ZM]
MNVNEEFVIEPIKFLLSETLLSGINGYQSHRYLDVDDPELALTLAFQQLLPDGYLILSDIIENSIGKFILREERHEAEEFLDDVTSDFSEYQSEISISYRKKKIRKENSDYEDFYSSIL